MASRSLGQLTVDVVAKTGGLTQGLSRADRELERRRNKWQREAKRIGTAVGVALGAGLTAAAAGLAVYVREADAFANISARLKLATDSQEQYNRAQAQTFSIAQETSTSLESVATLYSRLAQSADMLGLSQDEVAQTTENVTKALSISGTEAGQASAVILQLSQALASVRVQAEEFNSIIDAAPRIVQALADHMGIAFGEVKGYINEGKVSSQDLADALLNATDTLSGEFEEMPLTVGRSIQQVRNALTKLIGDTDQAAGSSADLAEAIAQMARVLESDETKRGFAEVINGLSSIVSFAADAVNAIGKLSSAMEDFSGISLPESLKVLIRGLTGGPAAGAAALIEARIPEDESTAVAATQGVDFTRPAPRPFTEQTEEKATAGVKARTAAVKELTEAEKQWLEFEQDMLALQEDADQAFREVSFNQIQAAQQQQERQQAVLEQLAMETQALHLTNEELAIRNALLDAGVEDESEFRQKIIASVENLYEQGAIIEDQIDAMDGLRDAASGFLDDLKEGEGFFDAMKNAADRLLDTIFEIAAQNVIESLFGQQGTTGAGTTGGNWFSNLLGAFFGGGRANGGWASPNMMYEVNERGFEMATVGGRDYMLTGSNPVEITPNHRMSDGGSVIQNFYNPVMSNLETDSQRAQYEARKAQRALARA